jgi:exopolysaccharide production protein ExoZ
MSLKAALPLAPLRSVQSLRALAALSVLIFHICQWMPIPAGMTGTPSIGSAGVDLFFVISGLVLWLSVNQRDQSAKQFLLGRAVRVVPAYWVATLIVTALVLIDDKNLTAAHFQPLHLVLSLAFIPHLNPAGEPFPILPVGWSLTYEALFYLIIGLSLWQRPANRLVFIAMGLIGVWMFGFISSDAAFLIANPMLMEFIFGLLIGQAVLSRALPGPWVSGALMISGLGLLGAQYSAVTDFGFWRALVWGGPCAMIVGGIVGLEWSGRWLRLAPLESLGEMSYSLYLVHWPVTWLLGRHWTGDHGLGYGAAVIALALPVAWLFWCLVEQTSLKALRRRFELEPARSVPIVAP